MGELESAAAAGLVRVDAALAERIIAECHVPEPAWDQRGSNAKRATVARYAELMRTGRWIDG